MSKLAFFILASLALFAPASAARDMGGITYPETVLELFTSQGCSSCPPANKFLCKVNSPNIFTLSYSVDYWDYLGWKDTLGSPAFSQRQREYSAALGTMPYTPQLILNGSTHATHFTRGQIKKERLSTPSALKLTINEDGLRVVASGPVNGAPYTLTMAEFIPGEQDIAVGAGENKGRTIHLVNVVTSVKTQTRIDAGAGYAAYIEHPEQGTALAVLLQDGTGTVISAAVFTP